MKNLLLILILALNASYVSAQQVGDEFPGTEITFEMPYENISIDTSSQNIWQIGIPNKLVLDSAYSPVNAIITDTINRYPTNNRSYFDLQISDADLDDYYGFPYNIFIRFKHKFSTDTLRDGGYISVSWDLGETWGNIIYDDTYENEIFGYGPASCGECENLYTTNDTLFNGERGFSGKSDGWITTEFNWHILPVHNNVLIADTMILRFNFISDNIENFREGWMIDDIEIYSVYLGSGINELNNRLAFDMYPNPTSGITYIKLDNHHPVNVSLMDYQGKLMWESEFGVNEPIPIHTDELNSGLYFVKIQTEDHDVGIKRLVVK